MRCLRKRSGFSCKVGELSCVVDGLSGSEDVVSGCFEELTRTAGSMGRAGEDFVGESLLERSGSVENSESIRRIPLGTLLFLLPSFLTSEGRGECPGEGCGDGRGEGVGDASFCGLSRLPHLPQLKPCVEDMVVEQKCSVWRSQ